MSSGPVVPKGDGVLAQLRVSPGAKGTGLQGAYGDGALKLGVAAPPVDGETNLEVERFLAGLVGAAPSGARVVRGLSVRDKTVFLGGVDAARVREAVSSRRP